MSSLVRSLLGVVGMLALAALLGLCANALRHDPLPLIRASARQTHRVATSSETLAAVSHDSISIEPERKNTPPKPLAAPAQPKPLVDTKVVPPARPARPAVKAVAVRNASTPVMAPKKAEAFFIELADAKKLFDRKTALFIDARHKEDYDALHIRGARSLFVEEFDKLHDDVMRDVPKDRTIITYCSEDQCETSSRLADALVARGYTHVFILIEGLPGWEDAEYPTEGKGN